MVREFQSCGDAAKGRACWHCTACDWPWGPLWARGRCSEEVKWLNSVPQTCAPVLDPACALVPHRGCALGVGPADWATVGGRRSGLGVTVCIHVKAVNVRARVRPIMERRGRSRSVGFKCHCAAAKALWERVRRAGVWQQAQRRPVRDGVEPMHASLPAWARRTQQRVNLVRQLCQPEWRQRSAHAHPSTHRC